MLKQLTEMPNKEIKKNYMTRATKFSGTFKSLINLKDPTTTISIQEKIKKYVKKVPPPQKGRYDRDEDYIVENPKGIVVDLKIGGENSNGLPFFKSVKLKLEALNS